MKTHEFAAIAIVLLLVVWVGFAALSPTYAARNKLLPNSLGGIFGAGSDAGANLAGNDPAAGSGAGANTGSAGSGNSNPSASGALGGPGQTVTIPIKVVGGYYDPREIRVKQGTRVKLVMDVNSFTGCMRVFNIWGLNQKLSISPGSNVLEFTADTPGTYRTSCNMGMGDGRFIVEAADGTAPAPATGNNVGSPPIVGPTGSCGGSGAGGCGGAAAVVGSAPSAGGCGCGG